jgi:hypothetical protein
MNQTSYEQVIIAGVRNLSPERQREVADFVYFLRQREENGVEYEHLIEADLAALEADELKHLDEEFKDYEQLYPRR